MHQKKHIGLPGISRRQRCCLRYVRRTLIEDALPRDFCHDLLARIIFTQFLFHRKDSSGNPFFGKTMLSKRCEGALKEVHLDLTSIRV